MAQKPNPNLAQFAEALGKNFQKRMKEKGGDNVEGQLPKPDFQHLHPKLIEWQWNPIQGKCSIRAVYSKVHKTYDVTVIVNRHDNGDTTTAELALTGTECKILGEALLSAYQWETCWQAHVGEFLTEAEPDEISDGSDSTVVELPKKRPPRQRPPRKPKTDG